MKIGNLLHKYGVSRETLHYYIRIGLLNPTMSHGQYDFTERDEQDLEDILRLKSLHFKLEEIMPILNWKKFSLGAESSMREKYLAAFAVKEKELLQQSRALAQSAEEIRTEMERILHADQASVTKLGVPLPALPWLVCPDCGSHLELFGANFDYQSVYQGELRCGCGYGARIKNGIICTGNRDEEPDDRPDLERQVYQQLDSSFVKAHQSCSNQVMRQLKGIDTRGNVLLEGNINGYFFLYNRMKELDPDCLYIIVDKYEEQLEMYRELMEQAGLQLKVLFIADAQNKLPLAAGCVDILVNFFSENEWQLYHEGTYLEASRRYLKKGALTLGAYNSFPKASESRKNLKKRYPRSSTRCHNIDFLIQDYQKQGVDLKTEQVAEFCHTESGYSLSCHQAGENLTVYYITAMM